MAHIEERRKAIELRLAGNTYTYIRKELGLGKGTLSGWLKNIKLSERQLGKIRSKAMEKRIKRYINTTRERRIRIFDEACKEESRTLFPIKDRDIFIAGLFLYLGEGGKTNPSQVQISNSDPSIIIFSIYWLTLILKAPKDKLRIQLHLYKDMDIEKELFFWENTVGLPRTQFIKPYIKQTSSQRIDHPSFGHGTCSLYYSNTKLKRKIMANIKILLESINGRIV